MEKSYLVQMKFSSAMNRYFNVPIKTVLRQNLRGISILTWNFHKREDRDVTHITEGQITSDRNTV